MFWLGLLVFGVASAKHEAYDGHTLFKIKIEDADQALSLNTLVDQLHLDVWIHGAPGRDGFVLVPGDLKQSVQDEFYAAGIKYTIEVDNIKKMLELEDRLMAQVSSKSFNKTKSDGLRFDRIYNYAEVNAYLEDLASSHPNVTLVNAGKSFEGRDIKYLKISSTNFQNPLNTDIKDRVPRILGNR